jgi:hypothetical protein
LLNAHQYSKKIHFIILDFNLFVHYYYQKIPQSAIMGIIYGCCERSYLVAANLGKLAFCRGPIAATQGGASLWITEEQIS